MQKGLAIQAAAQDLNLDQYTGTRLSESAKRAVQYGDEAAKRYMERMKKQTDVAEKKGEE